MSIDQNKSSGAPETGARSLAQHGLRNLKASHWNLGVAQLLEHIVQRGEGAFAGNGAFLVRTGQVTGRWPL
jgi:phosphoenolpyruvate carboxykinase (ATP)